MNNEADEKCREKSKAGLGLSTHDDQVMSMCDAHTLPPASIHLTDRGPKPGPSVLVANVKKKHVPTSKVCSEL